MTELCDLSAVELSRRIARRDISPVELLDSCLTRIETVNPTLNAVVAADEGEARKAAQAAERAVLAGEELGLLHGLPIGIKDLNDTAGLRTTYGSQLFENHVPEEDALTVARMRQAGGIPWFKTNTPEYGAGANTRNFVYGATGNPFNPELTCAGSSGGSAVALATSMLPLCNGSDLGGSLRTPAAYCGVVGLRPTPGLVPKEGSLAAYAPLSVEGPMGRSVSDLALLLSVQAGEDARDPLSRPVDTAAMAAPAPADLSSLRVAFSEDLGFAPMEAEVLRLFRERTGAFRHLFADSFDRDPEMGEDPNRVFEVLRAVGFLGAHLDKVRQTPDKVGPNVTANVELGLTYSAEDVAWANVRHTQIYRRFLSFMDEVDVLIAPASSVQPFDKNEWYPREINGQPLQSYIHWVAIAYGLTLTGHPVLCLPCGSDEKGLPFGIQIVGRRFEEAKLLSIGLALEQALAGVQGCGRPVPDLSFLAAR
ncbi:MAG TPA: amidase family protein [Kiloniellales bacterium]|jgi:amidase|nr:amidase family protein [Kiloniellales bacterium]